jgi:DNA-binding FadR family transcriptional regulator
MPPLRTAPEADTHPARDNPSLAGALSSTPDATVTTRPKKSDTPRSRAEGPVSRKSRHGSIVGELGMGIVSGEFPPETTLPPESALLDRFGVSRSALREAIRVLSAKGLVVSRQRTGVVVRPPSQWHLLDPDVLSWLVGSQPQAAFLRNLLDVRRVIEPGTAALAALAATQEELVGIRDAYERMEAAADSPADGLEPDVDFHRRIAEATHNPLLAHIGSMLSLALRESIQVSNQAPNTHVLSLPRHKAVLTALEHRDALAARQAVLVLLDMTTADLAQALHLDMADDLGTGLETPAATAPAARSRLPRDAS